MSDPKKQPAPKTDVKDGAKSLVRKSLLYKIPFRAHKLCRKIPSPRINETLRQMRERDHEENDKTTPESNETSELLGYWGVEFYTPSQIETLIKSFKELEWDEKNFYRIDQDPIAWLQKQRASSFSVATHRLGVIKRPDDKRNFIAARVANLPDFADYAVAEIHQVTPSLTALIVCFVSKPTELDVYDRKLRARYQTSVKPYNKTGYIYQGPSNQKRDQIAMTRVEYRTAIKQWFATNAPGIFSKNADDKFFPTCEILAIGGAEPFPGVHVDHREFLSFLNLDSSYQIWGSEEIKGLKFSWPVEWDNKDHHAMLAISKDDAELINYEYHNEKQYTQCNFLTVLERSSVPSLLIGWSCIALLNHYQERLSVLRDSKFYSDDPLKLIERLSAVIPDSMDIATICPELKNALKSVFFPMHRIAFKLIPKWEKETDEAMDLSLREGLKARLEVLVESDKIIKALVAQQSNLLATKENIQLQKRMWVLTIITAVLAFISALQTWDNTAKSSSIKTPEKVLRSSHGRH